MTLAAARYYFIPLVWQKWILTYGVDYAEATDVNSKSRAGMRKFISRSINYALFVYSLTEIIHL